MSNSTLPVVAFLPRIVQTVRKNRVTVLVGETGSGKTTQVPRILMEAGYDVIVTQPRRLAASSVATRVARNHGTPLGDVIGFRTAYDGRYSKKTRCLFATDGLVMNQQIGSGEWQRGTVLVIDETHEQNLNIEVLMAYTKLLLSQGVDLRVVLMSATLDAKRLSAYFDDAPIIEVPGRLFPVEDRTPLSSDMEQDIAHHLRMGHNVLAFQPGEGEIDKTILRLQSMQVNAEILPLHGKLSREEQELCFRSYGRPKCVVATDVAATSITISDIDVVFDSGTKKSQMVVNGVKGLYLVPISIAERTQRMGRAGRTKAGIYYDYCTSAYNERPKFPVPEILRTTIDTVVLQLAGVGIDAEELSFFNQPDRLAILHAKRTLVALGCLDSNGRMTPIGQQVSKLPVSVKHGRMIIEAERLGVADDVITVAAILEQGGITARACPMHRKNGSKNCKCWHSKLAAGEISSDVLAQLLVYQKCATMNKNQMYQSGISVKDYHEVTRKREQLAKALKVDAENSSPTRGTGDKSQDILRAVCAGMVADIYVPVGGDRYVDANGVQRQLSHVSVVVPQAAHGQAWLVGVPFDLELSRMNWHTEEMETVVNPLLTLATVVDPQWLTEVAPHLLKVTTGANPRYDRSLNEVVSTTQTSFNGHFIKTEEVLDPKHADAQRLRREGRSEHLWLAWTARPEVMLQTAPDGTVTMPEIYEHAYGVDAETGEPLVAYAMLAYHVSRWATEPWFKTVWTRDRAEAEATRDRSMTYLERAQAEATQIAERQRLDAETNVLRQAAEPFVRQLTELWDDYVSDSRNNALRTRVYYARQLPIVVNATTMQEWTTVAHSVIEEVNEIQGVVQTAQLLRNDVNGLLCDNPDRFVGSMLDGLNDLDVEDYDLPETLRELNSWIARAESALAEAQAFLSKSVPTEGVDPRMLAALAGKFGGRR